MCFCASCSHTTFAPFFPRSSSSLSAAGFKDMGWRNMGFVFLNRYLDLVEAIEDGSLNALDNSDFADTDVPLSFPLPEDHFLPVGATIEEEEENDNHGREGTGNQSDKGHNCLSNPNLWCFFL